MAKAIDISGRLRLSALLILLGLGLEAVSFFWNSPLAFFLFILGTGLLVVLGILIFLWALVAGGEAGAEPTAQADEPAKP